MKLDYFYRQRIATREDMMDMMRCYSKKRPLKGVSEKERYKKKGSTGVIQRAAAALVL